MQDAGNLAKEPQGMTAHWLLAPHRVARGARRSESKAVQRLKGPRELQSWFPVAAKTLSIGRLRSKGASTQATAHASWSPRRPSAAQVPRRGCSNCEGEDGANDGSVHAVAAEAPAEGANQHT